MVHLNHSFFVGIINLVIKMSLTNKVPEKDVHDLFTRVAPHYDQKMAGGKSSLKN